MTRLIASRAELDRLVRRIGGVDGEDLRAYALGEDDKVDERKLERIEHARAALEDVAMSPLWGAIEYEDDE